MSGGGRLKVVQMLPALGSGGVERGTLELSRYLVEQGHESIVISAGGCLREQVIAEGARHLEWDVGRKRPTTLKWIRQVNRLLRDEQPNVLHLRSRLPAWIGYLAWKRLPPKQRPHLVTTVHGLYSVGRYSSIMTRGERIIAVSETVADYIRSHYPSVDPSLIRVINRGVDRAVYPPGFHADPQWRAAWRKDFPHLKGRFVVTLPARLTRRKGQIDFIDIIGDLNRRGIPVSGLVVGGANCVKCEYTAGLRSLTTRRGLDGTVHFLGNRIDLREIMSVSDVVLSLSTGPEAFGRTTIEALSLGVPVAGYDHGGVREQLVRVLPEGQVPPGDKKAMADLLARWYIRSPTVVAEHPYTLQLMLSRTEAVYQELMGE